MHPKVINADLQPVKPMKWIIFIGLVTAVCLVIFR